MININPYICLSIVDKLMEKRGNKNLSPTKKHR